MFSLTVSDHIMIAHSIRGAVFGPAQVLHGNTLVVEVEFRATALDELNFLIDINLAKSEMPRILDLFDYHKLGAHPALIGQNTTTEFHGPAYSWSTCRSLPTGKAWRRGPQLGRAEGAVARKPAGLGLI
jgi:6-pyruvoyl-tetrahydropterin synthase